MDAGDRKKRKVEFEQDTKQEKNDDQEVEEFFALIRSNREIRERMNMMNASSSAVKRVNIEQQNKVVNDNVPVAVAVEETPWKPTFRPEDFMEDGPSTSNQNVVFVLGEESLKKEENKEDEKKDDDDGGVHVGLNLNLFL
ncbi:hypothetical protein LIER_28720 [Lithospermum erythrorhizon]|uniref:Uncharacterized protein n=1 Tax=Lithospermum erythrorhizon TaxID=34254 RepID=A0AAV3RIE3_LITER